MLPLVGLVATKAEEGLGEEAVSVARITTGTTQVQLHHAVLNLQWVQQKSLLFLFCLVVLVVFVVTERSCLRDKEFCDVH